MLSRDATWALLLLGVALLPRVIDLGSWVNVDAINYWSVRTRDFWQGVATQEWSKTYQVHPGVTLMWLAGAFQKLWGTLDGHFSPRDVALSQLPVSLVSALTVSATYLLVRRWQPELPRTAPALAALFLATEPFFVGYSRSMHVDVLAACFGWLGALTAGIALKDRAFRWAAFSGLWFGLALLSRIPMGAVLAGAMLGFALTLAKERDHRLSSLAILSCGVTCITLVLLWPAMLFEPVTTLANAVAKPVRWAAEHSSRGTISWGRIAREPGPAFYAAVLLTRLTPEVLASSALGLLVTGIAWREARGTLAWLLVCFGPFAAMLLLAGQKHDRYMLMLYPALCLFAGLALDNLLRSGLKRLTPRLALATALGLAVLLGGVRVWRLARSHPHPVAWCSELPGMRCDRMVLMGLGEGMREAALWIGAREPGRKPRIYGPLYAPCMKPWLTFRRVRHPARAEYLVHYVTERQRRLGTRAIRVYSRGKPPLHRIYLGETLYVEIFAGPKLRQRDGVHSATDESANARNRLAAWGAM